MDASGRVFWEEAPALRATGAFGGLLGLAPAEKASLI